MPTAKWRAFCSWKKQPLASERTHFHTAPNKRGYKRCARQQARSTRNKKKAQQKSRMLTPERMLPASRGLPHGCGPIDTLRLATMAACNSESVRPYLRDLAKRHSSGPLVHHIHQAKVEVQLDVLLGVDGQAVVTLQPPQASSDGHCLPRRQHSTAGRHQIQHKPSSKRADMDAAGTRFKSNKSRLHFLPDRHTKGGRLSPRRRQLAGSQVRVQALKNRPGSLLGQSRPQPATPTAEVLTLQNNFCSTSPFKQ